MAALSQISRLPRWTSPLRTWQQEACANWGLTAPKDALWVVCPAGGKTLGSARIGHRLLELGRINFVLFAVPTTSLRRQVAESWGRTGIPLDYKFTNDQAAIAADVSGVVVTYAQIAADPEVFEKLTRGRNVLAVGDEWHHLSEHGDWGAAVSRAFANARHRLMLSGTPFRTKGERLPFVRYDDAGNCIPDYAYTYPQAVADSVCRPIVIGLVSDSLSWTGRDGKRFADISFDDPLAQDRWPERLRTHLLAPAYIEVLRQAHGTLCRVREEGEPYGGLITAIDQTHARSLAAMMQEVCGHAVPVIVSDEPGAAKKLADFKRSGEPWLVAVDMVSEGVDIPRLRVGVWATTTTTELYWEQWRGRFTRRPQNEPEKPAYLFVPRDPRLMVHVARVYDEKRDAKEMKAAKGSNSVPSTPGESMYAIIGSAPSQGGAQFGALPLPLILDRPIEGSAPILLDEKDIVRKRVLGLVAAVCKAHSVKIPLVHATLNQRCGGKMAQATIDALLAREKICKRWLATGDYDGKK